MYLKMKGIDIATKIDLEESDLVARYYDKYNERYKEVELPPETEKIFDEFRILMLADDLSDPKLVEDMITSYRYMVATGNIFGSEILKLIEIKKNNPNFCIKRVNEGAYYRGLDTSINLCDSGLSTLNHETGHALYHLLADKKMPEEYPKFVEQFK